MSIVVNGSFNKLEGKEILPGIILMAEPTPIAGTMLMRCLANVYGALAIIELKISFAKVET